MKWLLIVLLVCIVLSLAWGLTALLRGEPAGTRLVRSLTLRIGLSIGLFMLLILGAVFGWWRPHHL
ncbi:MAG: DUF2909 domain-containing protein [Paludibacterium sp.]|uniref:DUF2909 domain-containing protein n=1 Tax=Paludibacterium sp. TaxID=1917523 RepID=UPI0025D173D6|nr:DUF2909 domain-containing protein [Paludibacterium sp.]MBV8045803.1 DUF2909 domain-containing protein [Paludibacterium sp.]MBV8647074.1 DUF2909 domain-containing protein [Paludibacterium sp.]